MKNRKRPIGIIGGMGPFASAELLNMVLLSARNNFGARKDEDFPEIILISIPVMSFFADEKRIKSVFKMIKQKINLFERSGVVSFGIACNTAHILTNDIKRSTDLNFVSIIEQSIMLIERMKINKIGLLASPVTIRARLYQDALEKKGLEVLLPNEMQVVLLGKIISDLVAKRNIVNNRKVLLAIANSLETRGAQAVILGCTEFPLAFPSKFDIPVINTIEVLADSLVEKYYSTRNKRHRYLKSC